MKHAEQIPNVEELVLHGVAELESEICGERAIAALRDCCREARSGTEEELPKIDGCPALAIGRDGELRSAWPDGQSTALMQDLVKRFLDIDELCASTDDSPRLYRMKWTAMAIEGSEYLLVCPYGGRAGDAPDGVVALCVTSLIYGRGER